jgi:hypothetical protein
VHGAAFHIRAERFKTEKALVAVEQGLRLAHRAGAEKQGERAVLIARVLEIEQVFDSFV